MSQTKAGGLQVRKTMIAKYGSEEAWSDHQAAIGAIGGRNGRGHAFGHGKLDPSVEGKKGGTISRRTWSTEERAQHSKKMQDVWSRLGDKLRGR